MADQSCNGSGLDLGFPLTVNDVEEFKRHFPSFASRSAVPGGRGYDILPSGEGSVKIRFTGVSNISHLLIDAFIQEPMPPKDIVGLARCLAGVMENGADSIAIFRQLGIPHDFAGDMHLNGHQLWHYKEGNSAGIIMVWPGYFRLDYIQY